VNGVLYKKCTRHKAFFPNENEWIPCISEYFYVNTKNSQDGLHPECKRCSVKKRQNDEVYEQMRKYAKKDYEDNPEYYQDKAHRRYREKTEECFQTTKNWVNKHKPNYGQKRKLHKKHEITKKEWNECKSFFNNSCCYCGLPVEEHYHRYNGEMKHYDLSKDHAYNNGSNKIDNCLPSCRVCNSLKNIYDWNIWYTPDNPLYNLHNYNKINEWLSKFLTEAV
jgi:hypothetical protein